MSATTDYRYAYVHGFASGPRSYKGTTLARLLAPYGVELELPDLNAPSFAELTYTDVLAAVDALDGSGEKAGAPWRFIGSSMGGWVAARWAELHPDKAPRLVLLCPGFDLPSRWPALVGADGMARWMAHGALTLPDGEGRPTAVHWGFIEDALRHPAYPEVPGETLILHGRRDEVVPIASSRRYAAERPHVQLIELDDDHGLAASVERIAAEVAAFWGLDRG